MSTRSSNGGTNAGFVPSPKQRISAGQQEQGRRRPSWLPAIIIGRILVVADSRRSDTTSKTKHDNKLTFFALFALLRYGSTSERLTTTLPESLALGFALWLPRDGCRARTSRPRGRCWRRESVGAIVIMRVASIRSDPTIVPIMPFEPDREWRTIGRFALGRISQLFPSGSRGDAEKSGGVSGPWTCSCAEAPRLVGRAVNIRTTSVCISAYGRRGWRT